MEMLSEYVVAVVIGICFAVGYILKNLIPSDKINRYIPLIMGCLGVVLNTWLNEWSFTPSVLLGGLASGLAATGTNELIKHLSGEKKSE